MYKYEKYKYSGVEWIGEIPAGWSAVRLKMLIDGHLMYGANEAAESDNRNYPRYIRITDIDENGLLKDETFKSLEPEKAKEYLLHKGDVLFARSGATVGKTYMFNENYQSCFAGYLIKASCNRNLNPMFLLRFTQSGVYNNWKNSIFIQSTIQNIGADKYNELIISLPSIDEQQSIINYLDSKCSKIDHVIATQQKRVELLKELKQSIITRAVTRGINPNAKMKDSGVEWIGEIPDHWEVKRLKYIVFMQSGETISAVNFVDEGYPVFGGNGFRGYADKYTNDGDHVLIGRQGALCGNINYAHGKFYASEHAIVVYPNSQENTIWLGELLRASNLNQYSQSAAQPGLSVNVIKNIYFPYPPRVERDSIASFINTKSSQFDSSIAKSLRQIELLKEYKQSLITEVVTGKRKVV